MLAKNVIDIVPSNLILCFSLIVIKTAIDYNKSENILKQRLLKTSAFCDYTVEKKGLLMQLDYA